MQAAFVGMHRALFARMGEPAMCTRAGGSVPLQALLDRNTAEIGEYGQTVAYRPSISVLNADAGAIGQGDVVTFVHPVTGAPISAWQVVRIAHADDMVTTFWVEAT